MAYRALYRQYRPTRFADVIGQSHITTTLRNQVSADRPAHAYLLCGTRGTGKTTTARILARAVNCLSPVNGEPCGKCDACLAMEQENITDITEIDAASNNGVDNVRDLIDNMQYAPLQLRRRVFIIDEVHMLSGAAFNALLKTLEEPPAHVVFILATTEPQKLPATIISRCQRFDFHRLSVADIKSTLETVLQKAGACVEDDGLMLISRAAQGGMRDALSLCDQCLSFCGDHVTTQNVYDVLGSMSDAFLFDIAEALLRSDAPRALSMLGDVVESGRDLSVFCADLAGHFRSLLLSKTCGRCETLLECTPDAMTRYLEQANLASEGLLIHAIDRLIAAQNEMRFLPAPRALLESVLIHICRPEDAHSFAALEARLARLEARLAEGISAPTTEQRPAPQAKPAPVPQAAPVSQPAPQDEPAPTPQDAPMVQDKPASQSAPQSEPVSTSAAPASDAATLWRRTIAGVENFFVQALAQEGQALQLEDDILTVGYAEAQEVKYKNMLYPLNFNPVQASLSKIAPGCKLMLKLVKNVPAPPDGGTEAAEKARALFGDKLKIE